MTSKISFYKLLKQDLRKCGGIMAVVALLMFLLYTLGGIILLDQLLSVVKEDSSSMQEAIKSFTEYAVYSENMMAVTIFAAILCGITRFAYLHSGAKLDLFHSIPVKREKLFGVQYLSGFILYVTPLLVNTLVVFITGAFRGMVSGDVVGKAVIGLFINLLFFLLIYSTVVLAVMMTGKIVSALLGALVFLLYLPGVFILNQAMFSMFFNTFCASRNDILVISEYTSPMVLYFDTIEKAVSGKLFFGDLLAGLLMLVVITGACIVLYRKRASEAAGASLAFKKTEGPIKFLLAVPAGIGTGLVAYLIAWNGKDIWLIAGVIFGVVIASAVIEFIYRVDFSKVLSRKRLLLASLFTALAVTAVFRFDLLRYDAWLPEASEVEDVAVDIDGLANDTFQTTDTYYGNSFSPVRDYVFKTMHLKNLEPIFRLLENRVEDPSKPDSPGTNNVTILYRMKNGKEKTRIYSIESKALKENLKSFYEELSFKQGIYPIIDITGEEIDQISLRELDNFMPLDLSRKQIVTLTDTFRREFETFSFEDMQDSSVLSLEFKPVNSKIVAGTYMLYPHFKETLSLLKEYGYPAETVLSPERVISIKATSYTEDGSQERSFMNKAEIQELVGKLVSMYSSNYLLNEEVADYEVAVQYLDKNGDPLIANMRFKNGDIPEIVKKAYEK